MLPILIMPGVSVLVHSSLQFCLVEVKTDPEGKYLLLHTYIADTVFVIVGLYLLPPAYTVYHYCILLCIWLHNMGFLMY